MMVIFKPDESLLPLFSFYSEGFQSKSLSCHIGVTELDGHYLI